MTQDYFADAKAKIAAAEAARNSAEQQQKSRRAENTEQFNVRYGQMIEAMDGAINNFSMQLAGKNFKNTIKPLSDFNADDTVAFIGFRISFYFNQPVESRGKYGQSTVPTFNVDMTLRADGITMRAAAEGEGIIAKANVDIPLPADRKIDINGSTINHVNAFFVDVLAHVINHHHN
jgi:hypothetical protein